MINQNKNNTKLNPNLIRFKSLYKVMISKSYEHLVSYFLVLLYLINRENLKKQDTRVDLEDQNCKTFRPSIKIYSYGFKYASTPIIVYIIDDLIWVILCLLLFSIKDLIKSQQKVIGCSSWKELCWYCDVWSPWLH